MHEHIEHGVIWNDKVEKLLALAKKAGYTMIGINRIHPSMEEFKHWPFDPIGSIFGYPTDIKDDRGWPPIWRFGGHLGIMESCGNSSQSQVFFEVEPQVWKLTKGEWIRI